uniref:Carbohydrate kinase PfkB domain-containing protein n=1 Tax=Fibrocapsa japonica TaxID=94617 RepID=A0A7S2Y4D8_9STRA|mmetsp:Transcript_7760/g.11809  ORF Transcript_7760/g.11809 Transcript_7760/m.11809 type:complete len:376 (+) Transcript_7760:47-1174(+)|eukprot:CAMPEP_0113943652 /NCGR_PEP_ID=MMETSP1339-20121228/26951_1 /TAXON_ID=94617 /ORGANISM="Fibrocapsa japonica" /LENGTH=375 /DNA_ID=CAMNT_0000948589 /DNA_START=41 /DNA_END=1168 /DNA_ORIENTATION=- /assembly_acc=CAM_ASM_000762
MADFTSMEGFFLGSILCAGLACLDMQMLGATKMSDPEAINTFQKTVYCAGGSAPMTSSALAHMGMTDVGVLIKLGNDLHGDEMTRQLQSAGVRTDMVIRTDDYQTSLSVLPIFESGGRACWVELGANTSLNTEEIVEALRAGLQTGRLPNCRVFHFGYPHLLDSLQGEDLLQLLQSVKRELNNCILSVDLNGVDPDKHTVPHGKDILGPALHMIDVLHANYEEAHVITGCQKPEGKAQTDLDHLRRLSSVLLEKGVGIVAITLGSEGAFLRVTSDASRLEASEALSYQAKAWVGQEVLLPAYTVEEGSSINANGAGDAFVGGLLASLACKQQLDTDTALRMALMTSLQRVDSNKRNNPQKLSAAEILMKCLAQAP